MNDNPHPWYGGCDGFGPNNTCAECTGIIECEDGSWIATHSKEVLRKPPNYHERRGGRMTRPSSVTDKQHRAICAMWRFGMSAPKIAAKVGCTPNQVWSIAHQNGLQRFHVNRFTDDDKQYIRDAWNAHVLVKDIAAKLGRTEGVMRQTILNMKLRRDGRVTRVLQWAPPELVAKRETMSADDFVDLCYQWRDTGDDEWARAWAQAHAENNAMIKQALEEIFYRLDLTRREKMQEMRAASGTLEQIAVYFGITRERVRQIITPGYTQRARAYQRGRRGEVPIKTMLRLWRRMKRNNRAAFLEAIGAKIR